MLMLGLFLAPQSNAETVSEIWGNKDQKCAHPGTLKATAPRLLFDLTAIPKEAAVYKAELYCEHRGQPLEPLEIYADEKAGGAKPLALLPPWLRSFDVTDAVKRWVKDPEKNKGFETPRTPDFPASRCYLEIRYEGKPSGPLPPAVDKLKAIHRNGQTFLSWQEIPIFRPTPDQIVYVDDFNAADQCVKEPGKDKLGNPRIPGLKLSTLRNLQGEAVRTEEAPGQEMPKQKRVREVPETHYRIYRSAVPITAETFKDAEFAGEADPLNIYNWRMRKILSHGEYYGKHEDPENVIATFCLSDYEGILPGFAFYVHSPSKDDKAYYAITVIQNGVENTSLGEGNSLAQPVDEKLAPAQPVKYFTTVVKFKKNSDKANQYSFLYWIAPPYALLPSNKPKIIDAVVPLDFKEPGPLQICFVEVKPDIPGTMMLSIEQAGELCYNDGQGTLKSYKESKLEYYPERYFMNILKWAFSQWKIDPIRIVGWKGMSLHLAIRHPELFGIFWPDGPEFYSNNFDQKWNPYGNSLASRIGPPEVVKTPDGQPGWEVFNIAWYLKQDPAKDIPFMGCLFSQPKDGNHGAEYGWQDDPKGWAALRDARQPFVAQWGGGNISPVVKKALFGLRWDRSVPAFSNCSLDNNPGNADSCEGEPWGQINGYLLWQYDDILDAPDRWEMTVMLVEDAPAKLCYVDVTPRHCKAFKPKAGDRFSWTNTVLSENKAIQTGELTADAWGLVTLPTAVISKGKNRLTLAKK